MIIPTRYGTLYFKKYSEIFGHKEIVIESPHSLFTCSCPQCAISRVVYDFKYFGYMLIKFDQQERELV